jgi:hypothetical protein
VAPVGDRLPAGGGQAGRPPLRLRAGGLTLRLMFALYLVIIATGLAFAITVGLLQN